MSNGGKIHFYSPEEVDSGWLCNYSNHPIELENSTWKTVEHYYQSKKFDDLKIIEELNNFDDPDKVRLKAKSYSDKKNPLWHNIKFDVMKKAVKAKFDQHLNLRDKLINTIGFELIENSPDDLFWGIGVERNGENNMGKILMDIREELFAAKIKDSIIHKDFASFSNQRISEELLYQIHLLLINEKQTAIQNLFEQLKINESGDFDWNAASLLQHFPPYDVVSEFEKHPDNNFYSSSGLCWLFGTLGVSKHSIIVYLTNVIKYTSKSKTWWAAGFSLSEITNEDAVSTLKFSIRNQYHSKQLSVLLLNLKDKKNVIGVLLKSNSKNIQEEIFPSLKNQFINTNDIDTKISCLWLFGRLRLIDEEIFQQIKLILSENHSYELKYYTLFALGENISKKYTNLLLTYLDDKDPLIRRLCARALSHIGTTSYLPSLNKKLFEEQDTKVIPEITKAIYNAKNPSYKTKLRLHQSVYENENGLIGDETDKWYADPSIYDIFSEAQDPENICFELILSLVENYNIVVNNPIDLATGTGKLIRRISEYINYKGNLYGVDLSPAMIDFVKKFINRSNLYSQNIQLIESSLVDLNLGIKSSLIISSFGFPSKIFNKNQCYIELNKVYEHLSDDGIFVTLGWDESFNDELNTMWYKFIKDDIVCDSFDEWRKKRSEKIHSARNCNLKWFKKRLLIPIQFKNLNESAFVMGHLFGRDAKKYILSNGITQWSMSMGITCNTKTEIKEILDQWKK